MYLILSEFEQILQFRAIAASLEYWAVFPNNDDKLYDTDSIAVLTVTTYMIDY
jgi:hypothetical protein